jgi:hypothetical protein
MVAFNKHLNAKKEGASKTYAEKKGWEGYRLEPADSYMDEFRPFTVTGDDEVFHKAKWDSFLKDACFYYDNPTLAEERIIRFKIQHRYDDLFADAWKPPLQSRKDLVQWTCQAHNAYM